jgi:hypothetical protein
MLQIANILSEIRASAAWQAARLLPKSTEPQRLARALAFNVVREKFNFTKAGFESILIKHKI